MYRLLVTGSRDWADWRRIQDALLKEHRKMLHSHPHETMTVVHGACYGADMLADAIARQFEWQVEPWPALWKENGKMAGLQRNAAMVNSMPDACVAFILNSSHGATHCLGLVQKAGIPWTLYAAKQHGGISRLTVTTGDDFAMDA